MYRDYSGTKYETQFRRDMERSGKVRAILGADHALLGYDVGCFPFRQALLRRLIGLGILAEEMPLECLHDTLRQEQMLADGSGQTPVAIACYDCGHELRAMYRRFLKEFIEPDVIREPFLFQAELTFRFSFPGSPGYTWRPNYHTDIALGHPPQEINLWAPLTECDAGNTLIFGNLDDSMGVWREFDYDFARYHGELDVDDGLQNRCARLTRPLLCHYGQLFVFDSRCMHLSQVNTTSRTRVSFEFRLVPLTDFRQIDMTYVGTGRRGSRFEPGGFYAPMSSADIESVDTWTG
jgi:hypothetical protein